MVKWHINGRCIVSQGGIGLCVGFPRVAPGADVCTIHEERLCGAVHINSVNKTAGGTIYLRTNCFLAL